MLGIAYGNKPITFHIGLWMKSDGRTKNYDKQKV